MGLLKILGLWGAASAVKTVTGIANDVLEIKDDLLGKKVDRQTVERATERIHQSIADLTKEVQELKETLADNAKAIRLLNETAAAAVVAIMDIAEVLKVKHGEHEKAAELERRVLQFQRQAS